MYPPLAALLRHSERSDPNCSRVDTTLGMASKFAARHPKPLKSGAWRTWLLLSGGIQRLFYGVSGLHGVRRYLVGRQRQ